MSSTIQYLVDKNPTVRVIDVVHQLVQSHSAWEVDKYTAGSELYIHNTTDDGTVGYYSLQDIEVTADYYSKISIWCNRGFDTNAPINDQPGVLKNTSHICNFSATYMYGDYDKLSIVIVDTNYIYINTLKDYIPKHSTYIYGIMEHAEADFDYVYIGILKKPFGYTGGNVITGSTPEDEARSAVYYEGANYQGWLTDDDGAYLGVLGNGIVFNHQNYNESLLSPLDFNTMSLRLGDMSVYAKEDNDHTYIGVLDNLYTVKQPTPAAIAGYTVFRSAGKPSITTPQGLHTTTTDLYVSSLGD